MKTTDPMPKMLRRNVPNGESVNGGIEGISPQHLRDALWMQNRIALTIRVLLLSLKLILHTTLHDVICMANERKGSWRIVDLVSMRWCENDAIAIDEGKQNDREDKDGRNVPHLLRERLRCRHHDEVLQSDSTTTKFDVLAVVLYLPPRSASYRLARMHTPVMFETSSGFGCAEFLPRTGRRQ